MTDDPHDETKIHTYRPPERFEAHWADLESDDHYLRSKRVPPGGGLVLGAVIGFVFWLVVATILFIRYW